MNKRNKYLSLTLGLLISLSFQSIAQTTCDAHLGHNGDKVVVHAADPVSIWGDVTNEDSAGIEADGIVIFYGKTWTNTPTSIVDVEGKLNLKSPRPAPYVVSQEQEITNNGGVSSFPYLEIDNPNNVKLNNHTIVRDTLIFTNGKVILNNNNLTILNSHPDAIQGYTEDRYVVTGNTTSGGYLERNGVAATTIDFPVGISTSSYTPASISNAGTSDNFSVRVFENVYEDGYTGVNFDSVSVDRTWDVLEETAGGSDVTLSLQHNVADEGSGFPSNAHFVTHYVGTAPNTAGDTSSSTAWDLVFTSNLQSGSTTGTITTGSPIANAVVTSRSGFTSFSPFTKSGPNNGGPLPIELLDFTGKWAADDAVLEWTTSSELNNDKFEIYRSLDGGITFDYIGEHKSLAPNGTSNELLSYAYLDLGVKSQVSDKVHYMIKQIDYDGESKEFGPVVLSTSATSEGLFVYPVPTSDMLNVEASLPLEKEVEVTITDLLGRTIKSFGTVEPKSTQRFDVSELSTGTYFIQFSSSDFLQSTRFIISK